MGFKLPPPPYKKLGVPVYLQDLGDDTLGKANNNERNDDWPPVTYGHRYFREKYNCDHENLDTVYH